MLRHCWKGQQNSLELGPPHISNRETHNFRSLLSPEYRNRTCKFFFCRYYFCLCNQSLFAEREVRRLHTLCLPKLNLPQVMSVWVSSVAPTQHYADFSNLAHEYVFSYRYKEAIKKTLKKFNLFPFPVTPP